MLHSLADTAEGRAGIIGALAVFQRSRFVAGIVIYQQDVRGIRRGGVRGGYGRAGLVFPEESVAVAVICSPLVSGVPRSMVNLPSLPVLPVPMTLPSASFSVMVLPGSAVPETVLPSGENCRPDGAFGGVVSGSEGFVGVPGLLPLSSSSSPPPPPPVLAAAAMPPAATMPPSTGARWPRRLHHFRMRQAGRQWRQ